MNWNVIIQKTIRWTAVSVAILIILPSILFGLAQTEIGKRQVARQFVERLGLAGKARIQVGKIEGVIPFDFRMDRLVSSDADGEVLTVEDLRLRGSPVALLWGRFRVKELSASLLQLNRLPSEDKSVETTPKKLPEWPSALNRLSVERFAIDRLILGREVLGQKAVFRLEARLRALNAFAEQNAEIHLNRIDGPMAEATVNVGVKHRGTSLRLHAKVNEAEGGVLAAFLRIPGPTILNLEGAGPLKNWRGNLKVAIGGLGELETSLSLETLDVPKLKAEGKMRVHSGRSPARLRRLLSDETRFAMTLRMPHKQSIEVDHLNFDGYKTSLRLKGAVDFEQQRSTGEFTLNCGDLALLGDPGGSGLGGSAEVNAKFSGPLHNPQTTLLLNIQNVEFDKFRADAMLADLRIGLVSPLSNAFSGIMLSGSGSLENFTHLNVQPVPERELRYRIDAEGPSKGIVQIRKFRLWGERTSLETSGYLRLTNLSGEGEVWLTVEDLKRVSRVFKADIPGSTRIHASFNGNARRRMFAARIEGQLNLPEASFTRISPLMGSNMRYAGQIRLADENNLTISSLQLDTETGKVTGTASLDLKHRELGSDFKIVVPKLSSLSPVLTRTIDGSLEMDGVISGAFSSPAVSVNAEARNLLFEGLNFETVTAKLQTEGMPPSIQGRLEVALRYAGQVFSGSSGFSLQEERLGLTALSIKSKENELTGKLALDLKSLLAEGKLQGNARKLSDLGFLFGEDLVGGAGIKTEFEIVNNKQKIGLDLRGWNLKSRFGHAEELNLRARLIDPFKKPSGNFALKGSGLRLGEVTLETLALAGEGTSEKISLHGKTSGKYTDSFEVETRGTLRATSKAQTLELNALGAHYGDLPLELRAPAAIYRTATGYRLETLSLRVGGGRLDGSGRLENRRLTLETDLKGLPLSDLPFSRVSRFTGSATGSLYVMGPIDRPQGSANLSLDALSLKDAKASDLPPATVNAQAELKKGRLKSHLTLQGLTAEPLKATLDIPLLFSFSPFVFSLPPTGEIWGNLDGDLDVERIHTLLGPDYQIVKGHFGVDFALTGTVDDPRITGQGKVGKGYYEYIPTGTVLRDAEVKITGDIPRVSIEAARATDGESGSVALEGWVDLVPGDRFPFQAALTFEQATLLRRDDINATVGGRAILAGSVEKAKLAGRIRAEHAEIRIPDRLPPNIADLQVIETRETTEEANRSPTPRVRRNLQLFLDLAVEGPGKIFVRGRGLDSEWKCDLHIAGTASEPKITGNLSVVRGRFNFLGKRFDIRQGSIAFNGDYPPSPVADIVTEARANDMTAELRLSGSLKDPELSLRSDPPLPSDEILSRVLFGRALTAITPFQALALADAARTLAGGGGGGFMEQTRSVLGVDQLEVSTDGEAMDQATVGAGKYLSDKVYLEVERGLDPQSSKARVQVEVTPNVTVESEVGANSEGGMGVRWKWDY